MRAKEFLTEYRRDITAQNLGQNLLNTFKREGASWIRRTMGRDIVNEPNQQIIDELLARLEKADPTPNKQYTPWLAKTYARGGYRFEDVVSTVADALSKFHNLNQRRRIPAGQNDILRYQNFDDFVGTVNDLPNIEDQAVDRGHADEVYSDNQIRIIEPQNETAACYYGQGTRWCTAGRNNNMFDTYAQDGSIYIIIPKQPSYPGEKYQFHFESNQFMDPQDNPVDLSALAKKYPGLKNAFWDKAGRYDIVAFMSDEQIANLAVEGQAYIKSHGKNHGDGIVTVNLNTDDPYNFALVPAEAAKVGAAVEQDLNAPRNDEETLYSGFAVIDTRNNEVYVVHSTINYDGAVDVAIGTTFTTEVTKNAANPRTEQVVNNLSADLESFLEAQSNGDEDLEVKFEQLLTKYGHGVDI